MSPDSQSARAPTDLGPTEAEIEFDVAGFMSDIRRDVIAEGDAASFFMVPKPEPGSAPLNGGSRIVTHALPDGRGQRALTLDDLLRHDGTDFINNAYLEILGRRADPDGSSFYSDELFSGRLEKRDIIEILRKSPEGEKRGVRIEGLDRGALRRRLLRVPLLGRALRYVWLLISLPNMARHQRALDAYVRAQVGMLASNIRAVDRARSDLAARIASESSSKVAAALGNTDRRMTALERSIEAMQLIGEDWQVEAREALARGEAKIGELIGLLDLLRGDVAERSNVKLDALRSTVDGIETQFERYRGSLLDQERRLTLLLEEARSRLPAKLDSDQLATFANESEHMLDRLYLMIEDRFRGTRADIKTRQALYLPDIRTAVGGTADGKVVDLGCGRGEWLELLNEAGIPALGVDSNDRMVESCRSAGFEVAAADALAFLRAAKAGAFSAITGFHIIEHIPFTTLIRIFDEALRTLKPGGAVVFETPNPSNLQVATHNFYVDPTHLKPLPSILISALLEARGFVRVEVRDLFPHPNAERHFQPDVLNEFNQLLYGPQDYGVIAWKPAE